MSELNCPICTKDHKLKVEEIHWLVCSGCYSLLKYESRQLVDYGETPRMPSDLPFLLQLGSTGELRGRWFEVIGHMHFRYAEDPEGDYWDEWFVRFKDNSIGFILAEDDDVYFYAKRSELTRPLPPFSEMEVGQVVNIEWYKAEIIEKDVALVRAFDGQLPDHPLPGSELEYIDATFRNYSISVEANSERTMLHFGIELEQTELQIDSH